MNPGQFRVGLTGGVGSGKTTVANMFEALGASVIDTDEIARELTASDGPAMPAIADEFGTSVVKSDGSLDRDEMRRLAFSNPLARRRLEAILHPMIRMETSHRCESAGGFYVVMVVPLLVEHLTQYRPLLDRIAVVDCDSSLQIARTAQRPGLDELQARAIVKAQVDRPARLAVADDVIENGLDLAALKRRVEELHVRYVAWAAEKSSL